MAKRKYLSQTDVPRFSLVEALRIPRAMWENYGGDATAPLKVAAALDMKPASSHFRMLAGAAEAYGLTSGGPKAAEISLTDLAKRILRPLSEQEDLEGKREALLTPRVVKEFLTKYSSAPLPRPTIAHNVLEDMGVPKDKTAEVHDLILEGARSVGFITEIKGQAYVDLSGTNVPATAADNQENPEPEDEIEEHDVGATPLVPAGNAPRGKTSEEPDDGRLNRVFVTHGKNRAFIDPIRQLLQFGGMEAVVATENQSVSKLVPDKVLESMRQCGAAIIHVDADRTLLDRDGASQIVLNPNVLIEIGAAMALYGRRFVLLTREGISLPSNLQGLYEVRYGGDVMDADATIRLLKAINDIKNHPLPE